MRPRYLRQKGDTEILKKIAIATLISIGRKGKLTMKLALYRKCVWKNCFDPKKVI